MNMAKILPTFDYFLIIAKRQLWSQHFVWLGVVLVTQCTCLYQTFKFGLFVAPKSLTRTSCGTVHRLRVNSIYIGYRPYLKTADGLHGLLLPTKLSCCSVLRLFFVVFLGHFFLYSLVVIVIYHKHTTIKGIKK